MLRGKRYVQGGLFHLTKMQCIACKAKKQDQQKLMESTLTITQFSSSEFETHQKQLMESCEKLAEVVSAVSRKIANSELYAKVYELTEETLFSKEGLLQLEILKQEFTSEDSSSSRASPTASGAASPPLEETRKPVAEKSKGVFQWIADCFSRIIDTIVSLFSFPFSSSSSAPSSASSQPLTAASLSTRAGFTMAISHLSILSIVSYAAKKVLAAHSVSSILLEKFDELFKSRITSCLQYLVQRM